MAYSLPRGVGALCLVDRASSLRTATKTRTRTTRCMASGQSRFHEDSESASVFPYDNAIDFHNGGISAIKTATRIQDLGIILIHLPKYQRVKVVDGILCSECPTIFRNDYY